MTTAIAPKRPPAGLGPRGRAWYRNVTANYDLTPAETELVHVAATGVDQLSRIELAVKQSKPTALGSAGQVVAHPLYAEWRATAETIRRICQQLDLPDLVEQSAAPTKKKLNNRFTARRPIETRQGA